MKTKFHFAQFAFRSVLKSDSPVIESWRRGRGSNSHLHAYTWGLSDYKSGALPIDATAPLMEGGAGFEPTNTRFPDAPVRPLQHPPSGFPRESDFEGLVATSCSGLARAIFTGIAWGVNPLSSSRPLLSSLFLKKGSYVLWKTSEAVEKKMRRDEEATCCG